jgi:selenide,water dikinase
MDLAREGRVPGGTRANLKYALPITTFDDQIEEPLRLALADAQTSGGLLLCMPGAEADAAVTALHAEGVASARVIGSISAGAAGIAVAP